MKTTFTKIFLMGMLVILTFQQGNAQYGLDSVIIEKYYKSDVADSVASVGILPVGSTTYRVYVSMLPGYKFQMAYGNSNHPLTITTTTSFFNNEDRGSITPNFTKTQAKNNTIMLDSWLSAGAACTGNYGILKSKDNGVSTVVNADGILQNIDTSYFGIPLTQQDGFIQGTPGTFGTIGADINAAIAVFDATSQIGNSFVINDGAWYCLAGATGPDTNNNQVLIAQITTNGRLSLKLNIQIGTPSGGIEKYVAENPLTDEYQRGFLSYKSDSVIINNAENYEKRTNLISVFPNPSKGNFVLNIAGESKNSENYYTVYNILGNRILSRKINNFTNGYTENINLNAFPNGIYFIELSLNGSKSTHKLVKN